MRRCLVLVLASIIFPGCGVVLQTALGWSSEEAAVKKTIQQRVHVETRPANAEIIRRGEGQDLVLGSSPLVDTVEYQVEERRTSAGALGLAIGGLAELAIGVPGWVLGRGEEKCFSDGECFTTEEPSSKLLAFSGTMIVLGAIDLILAVSQSSEDDVVEAKPIDRAPYAYLAKKEGFREAGGSVSSLDDARISLSLDPLPQPVVREPPKLEPPKSEPLKSEGTETWVIAVMDVVLHESRMIQPDLDPTLLESVADQVRVLIARRGYRTVDASSARKERARSIEASKLESYKECYDELCQIELGKALAASHIVRASISRFGAKCVLNAELIDLTSEVVVRAASATSDCLAEGFLTMSETVAKNMLP